MNRTIQRIKRLNSLKYFKKIFLVLPLFILFSNCATQKKRSEASWLKKFYHNTTAYYNGYFNANLLLREGIDKLNLQHQDNFTKVLNVYPYMDVSNPKSVATELDKATEKVSVVAALHPISYWVPDCYLMIGKCQYLKQDFETAEETMEYFKETFKPNGKGRIIGKDKKEIAAEKERAKKAEKEKKLLEKKKVAAEKEKQKEIKKDEKEAAAEAKADARKLKEKQKKEAAKQREKEKKQREKDRKKGIKTPKTSSTPIIKTPITEKKDSVTKKVEPIITKTENKEKEDSIANAKANEPKPEKYFLKHKPCYQEGMLLLGKIYTERQRYEEAISIFNNLINNSNTFPEIKAQTMAAVAHFYIKQKKYHQAIEPLSVALSMSNKKAEKARFSFILGQLHQLEGRGNEAYQNFEKVVAYHPAYEMEFNAKLNMALNGWINGKSTIEETENSLNRMLKDAKNKEYQDQIYFTLANLSLKNKQDLLAIDYFKKALANNTTNKPIKLESYLSIARLYFGMDKYVQSKAYYDSTLTLITKTEDRYNEVYTYSNGLTDIAKNITIIETQDSVLRISNMTDKEKKSFASKIIKEKKEKEKKEKEILAAKNNVQPTAPIPASSKSNFFAYDDKLVKKGKSDFERKFGTRKLEDNWRRANKKSTGDIASDDNSGSDSDNDVTDKDLADFFKDVPDNPDKIAAANDKIMNAMFALGGLYRDRLQNANKSAAILETLLTRYPTTKHELDSWYLLYLSYTDLNNSAKAKEYFDKIVGKYPSSNYAKVLQDPDYLAKSKQEEKKIQYYYDSTYSAFKNGQYKEAYDRSKQATNLFGSLATPLLPKFSLLTALCVGNLQGKAQYIEALKEVVAKYPETPEQKRAKEILRFLDSNMAAADTSKKINTVETIINTSLFINENEGLHYVIVVLEGQDPRIDDAKAQIADFNKQYFKLDQLKVSNIFLGSDTNVPIILVRKFDTKNISMNYYKAVQENKSSFLSSSFKYQIFPVTQNNYRQILKEKSLENYKIFFEENYK